LIIVSEVRPPLGNLCAAIPLVLIIIQSRKPPRRRPFLVDEVDPAPAEVPAYSGLYALLLLASPAAAIGDSSHDGDGGCCVGKLLASGA
jgi:hypothetical protein